MKLSEIPKEIKDNIRLDFTLDEFHVCDKYYYWEDILEGSRIPKFKDKYIFLIDVDVEPIYMQLGLYHADKILVEFFDRACIIDNIPKKLIKKAVIEYGEAFHPLLLLFPLTGMLKDG